jgi:uncharacterized protein YjbI with pentapeptide repeats
LAGQNLTFATIVGTDLTGADFSGVIVRNSNIDGLTAAQLYSTASYQAHDLTGIELAGEDLDGWNLSGQDLTGANLSSSSLVAANLSHANLRAYLYNVNFTGADLTHANLAAATLTNANLTNANLSGADVRGAYGVNLSGSAATANTIRPNGRIAGLHLSAGEQLVIRDFDGIPFAVPIIAPIPIAVEQNFDMGADGTLRLLLEADAWDSTISFAPGTPVTLGGTMELTFAAGMSLAGQVGRTFDLFDWTGVNPTGAFAVVSPYTWNLANLYTTGEVTLLAIPGLAGDFNSDGAVDAADYVAWRHGLGTIYTQGDFDVWRAHYGQTAISGASLSSAEQLSAGVPEPGLLCLWTTGLVAFPASQLSRRGHSAYGRGLARC